MTSYTLNECYLKLNQYITQDIADLQSNDVLKNFFEGVQRRTTTGMKALFVQKKS